MYKLYLQMKYKYYEPGGGDGDIQTVELLYKKPGSHSMLLYNSGKYCCEVRLVLQVHDSLALENWFTVPCIIV